MSSIGINIMAKYAFKIIIIQNCIFTSPPTTPAISFTKHLQLRLRQELQLSVTLGPFGALLQKVAARP